MTEDTVQSCDIIVRNGYVVTVDAERRIFAPGAVAVRGRTIAAVGRERDVLAAWRSHRVIDAHGAPVHPGFIDAHNHVVHQTCRGIFASTGASGGERVTFADWKADARDEDEYAAAALAGVEMLRNGFTGFVEPGTAFSTAAVAAAAEAVGVRGAVTEPYLWDSIEVMEHAGGLRSDALFRRAPADLGRAQKLLGGELYRNKDAGALVRGYIGLYGLGTASDELERAAKDCADENDVVFQQHEGYLPAIARAQKARLGRSGIGHLAALGVLDANSTLIHMNAIEDADEQTVLDTGLAIIWCPHVYLSLGISGEARCRMPGLYRRGAPIALATDGAIECTIGDAGRTAFLVASNAGDRITVEAVLEMQTIQAARASGWAETTGSLEPGKRADLVVRSEAAAEAQPGYNRLYQLALTARAGSVDTVLVDGEIVFRGGRATRVDEGVVHAEALASVGRRVERLGLGSISAWPIVGD